MGYVSKEIMVLHNLVESKLGKGRLVRERVLQDNLVLS